MRRDAWVMGRTGMHRGPAAVAVLALVAGALAIGSIPAAAAAAGGGSVLWTMRDEGDLWAGYDAAHAVAVSPDGSRVFITGGAGHYLTIAYHAGTGVEAWAKHHDGDDATGLVVSPDGSTVFVTGSISGNGTRLDYGTVAYRARTGAKIWAARYDGPASRADGATSLAVSPDGSTVFVTGESAGSGTDADYATVAYDAATGGVAWASRYDGPASGGDHASSLAVGPGGTKVFVTGGSDGGIGTGDDYATVTYKASTGVQGWARRYDGPASGADAAYSLGVSPDGRRVFVTGGSKGGGGRSDYATLAYQASTGAKVWVRRYDGSASGLDYAQSLVVSPDGLRVYVTGSSIGTGTSKDYMTFAYETATGATDWARRYDGPATGASSTDNAHAVAVSPDGSKVVVTGESQGLGTGQDYATVCYTA